MRWAPSIDRRAAVLVTLTLGLGTGCQGPSGGGGAPTRALQASHCTVLHEVLPIPVSEGEGKTLRVYEVSDILARVRDF